MNLYEKIRTKKTTIGVIGLGYVGLPLCVHFAKKGFKVIGFDIKKERVDLVNKGKSYIQDVDESELNELVSLQKIMATCDYDKIKECDVIQICVPTPVSANKDPIISYVVNTVEAISPRLRREQLIILKSTTAPETTEKIVLPILERSGLKVGKDFYLAFSPERIDPGNKKFTVANTPTVVGGVTPTCTKLTKSLYESIIDKVVPVSSPKVAEMTKLLENTFRNVNIALVNEFAQLCERMEIDIWEVIDAAATKPFGFMPFYPGPGVGGHCIPIDPYYLAWKAREYDFHTNFIELAAETNENMPYYVVNKVMEALSKQGICPSRATVLVLGVTFKRDVKDLRDSPALKIIRIMDRKIGRIIYNDPYIDRIEVNDHAYTSTPLTEELLQNIDGVLIITDHTVYDYGWIVAESKLIIDTRNATKNVKSNRKKIIKLGKDL